MKDIRDNIHIKVYEQHWSIGLIEHSAEEVVAGRPYEIHYLKGLPGNCWFADPFILDYDEQSIQVLAEEYNYRIRRGRIARLLIDRHSYKLISYNIILDLHTHLSFPLIERKNGKVYIYPENSASGQWSQYEYDLTTDKLTQAKTIINVPLTDAIKMDIGGEELIVSTRMPAPNGNELFFYNTEGRLIHTQRFSSNVARNAGDWFCVGERVYRPAQDCNGEYGKAVIIQEVNRKTDGTYSFSDLFRITSTHPKYTTGCHTFNGYKELCIVDVHGYRRPSLIKVIESLKEMLKK